MTDNTIMHSINYIVSTPGICDGQPRIDGTRMTVKFLSMFTHDSEWSVEKICEEFNLTLPQVYAAFAYYYDHREEIDRSIEQDRLLVEQHRADPEYQALISRMKKRKLRD